MEIQTCFIPTELKGFSQWVRWKYDSEKKKIPINPKTGRYAKVTDLTTWSDYQDTLGSVYSHQGMGFVLTEDDPFGIIDLDKCIQDNLISEFAQKIVEELNSYTEVSPSGKGLRIIFKTSKPFKALVKPFELYYSGRYFTVTGNHLENTPIFVNDCTHKVFELLNKYREEKKVNKTTSFNIKATTTAPLTYHIHTSTKNYLESAKRNALDELIISQEGDRNNTLLSSSRQIGQIAQYGIAAKLWTLDSLQEELIITSLSVGLKPDEIRKTIKSGLEFGLNHPKELIDESKIIILSKYKVHAVYEYMIKHINYNSGLKLTQEGRFEKGKVWADLDIEFNKGLLATAFFQSSLGKFFDTSQSRISSILRELRNDGWIKIEDIREVKMYNGQIQRLTIYSLGIFEFDQNSRIIKTFYSNLGSMFT